MRLRRNRIRGSSAREEEKRETIIIEVGGGVVIDVLNIPAGYDYEIIDHDTQEAEKPYPPMKQRN